MSRAKVAALGAPVWHVVDARAQVVGRLAPQIATLLMGKHKPTFSPATDGGDYVVVLNARHAALTGDKASTKLYRWHTGWMGGLKTLTARQVAERDPTRILRHAVKGMMPRNPARDARLFRLRIFPDGAHGHAPQAAGSAAYAPAFLAAAAPRPSRVRPQPDTGAMVVSATPEAAAAAVWTKLEHDPAMAAEYEEYLAKQARARAAVAAYEDARVIARAAELDAGEAAERARARAAAAGGAAGAGGAASARGAPGAPAAAAAAAAGGAGRAGGGGKPPAAGGAKKMA